MRKMTSAVCIAALSAAAATVIAAGSANAATPVTPPAADQNTVNVWLAPGVRYTGNTDDRSAVLSTPIGTLTTQGNALQVKDVTGRTVFGQRDFATPPKASTLLPAESPCSSAWPRAWEPWSAAWAAR
ncbi:uncharacterized protein YdaL [Nocardia sp. GAS34]|uniref:hypothetical protein n=1 Tax=unclassified Nocardia TaxID=2637762 RepID=UPI003D20E506